MKFSLSLFLLGLALTSFSQRPFITTWKTDNLGSSENNQITIPTTGESILYNYTVDWGDGTVSSNISEDITHTYPSTGNYTVSITGDFPRIYFNNGGDKEKIISIDQWGDNTWASMGAAFYGCTNLKVLATDAPVLNNTVDMGRMFADCSSLNESINHWDVSSITNMSELFNGASSFDQPLDDWDVSSVQDMGFMFSFCTVFNQPLTSWEVANVTDMGSMFQVTGAFNQPLNGWNVSNVTSMAGMFLQATAFNQTLEDWDVGNVTSMGRMFETTNFNQDISRWNVSKVVSMASMFAENPDFNHPLNSWDVSSVTNFGSTFRGAVSFNQSLSNWDVSNVNTMSEFFSEAFEFDQDLSSWDVSKVTTMSKMFSRSSFNQDISSWDVSNVSNMSRLFEGTPFNKNISNWNLNNVTTMFQMFRSSRFNQPIGSWNVSNVTTMEGAFSFTVFDQDISEWDVSAVINMADMFSYSKFNQDISYWDVSSVTNMEGMFDTANDFNQDLDQWDVKNVINMSRMFSNSAFNHDISGWDVINVTDMSFMFFGASLFNQDLSNWDISSVTSMDDMLLKARSLSSLNYDKLLLAWVELSALQRGVSLGAGEISYCLGDVGRSKLINDFGWTITGDVLFCGPQIPLGQVFEILENAANGSLVGTVKASDPDGTFTFSISSGNVSDAFAIDATTGKITVANEDVVDYEINQSYEIGIEVADDDVTNSRTIFINLLNEFDTPLITTWKTNNEGTSMDNQITIPTIGLGYDYKVNWGDGSTDTKVTGSITHTYEEAGEYEVIIDGDFPQIYFNVEGDRNKILSIDQWSDYPWSSMELAFSGCENLIIAATNEPNLTEATSLERAFWGAKSVNVGFLDWEVSGIENFTGMFSEAVAFNDNIRNWDMSNAQFLTSMFAGATAFNSAIDFWDVRNVVDMSGMLSSATSYQRSGLNNWDVRNVTNMSFMFSGATFFNQDLSNWDVSNVIDMTGMFDETGLYTINYDTTLSKWAELPNLQSSVTIGARDISYCLSEEARTKLINDYQWNFVGDVQSCKVQINPQRFAQQEVSQFDTFVGRIFGSDPKGTTLSFSIISGNENGVFELDNNVTGQGNSADLLVAIDGFLDFETEPIISLEVQVVDGDGNIENSTITVILIDVDEAPIVEEQSFSIPESAENGSIVGNVLAKDPEDKALSYLLLNVQGTTFLNFDNQPFNLNIESGEVTVAKSEFLDFQIEPVYNLEIEVSDGNLRSYVNITINIANILMADESALISVYPNPASDFITLKGTEKIVSYQIFDVRGIKLDEGEVFNSINISSLTGGVYVLKLFIEGEWEVVKFYKK